MAWKLPSSPVELGQRAGAAVLTGGLSEVDQATGNNAGNAIKGAGDAVGGLNPLKKNTTTPYDPTAPAQITAPTMAPGAAAPTVNANGLTGAKIGEVADPRMAVINMTPQDQFRQQQVALAQKLAGQANGTGPSVAENQLRKGQEANLAGTMAVLNSQRGAANPGLARQAMETNAEQQGKLAMDASTARLQEQMQAAGMLNTVAGTARGEDIGAATSQAQLDTQANLAKYQGSLQTALEQGRIDQNTYNEQMQNARQNASMAQQFQSLQAQYASMGMNAAEANQAAALKMEELKSGNIKAANAANAADLASRQKAMGAILSGGASAAGTLMNGGSFGSAIGGQAAPGAEE